MKVDALWSVFTAYGEVRIPNEFVPLGELTPLSEVCELRQSVLLRAREVWEDSSGGFLRRLIRWPDGIEVTDQRPWWSFC